MMLAVLPGLSQTSVKITADRNRILIGEPIKLSLQADIPENEPIRFFSPDSMAHFEILRVDKIDTTNTSKGTILKGAIYVTSFDSGHWVIPPLRLRDSIYTDSIPVDVGYTPFDVSKPYNDIKEILEANEQKKAKAAYWWYIAGGLLVLAVIFYFVFRKKKKPAATIAPLEDPFAQATRELSKLATDKPQKDEYYSRLVNIFRVYVLRRKGIESMQQTTGDLVEQLRKLNLPAKDFSELASTLQFSDLVKFARFDSSPAEDQQSFTTIRSSIEWIEQDKPANQ